MPAKLNLINQRFDKLLVLGESQNRKNGRVTWSCQCDCGNIVDVTAKNLRDGITRSCGCLKKKNLVGQVFGKLTVIDYTNDVSSGGSALWKCRCECGKLTYASTEGLRTGDNRTCGRTQCRNASQLQYEQQMIGKKFGKLTVISKNENKGKYGSLWNCICECGNTYVATTNHLITHNTQSCGCLLGHSIGEQNIKTLLDQYNIPYKAEYIFPEFPNRRYDFAIFDSKGKVIQLIEFDGEQHFIDVPFFKLSLEEQQKIDLEKTNFAKDKQIKLVRTPYYKRNDLTLKDLEVSINA